MLWPTLLFCNLLSGILCVILTRKLGKPSLPWFLLCVPFGVLVLFVLLYLQEREKTVKDRGLRGLGS